MIKGVQYQYGYDAEDRLITVNDISGNKIASYTYDAEGNRSTKTTYSNNNPVNTTTYHYYNGELLYETLNTDPANVIHALYIRTPAGALEAVSLNYVIDSSSNTFYYYHYNAHGDVIAVTKTDSSDPTNITGKIYRQYTYDPYGNIISAKDGSGNVIDINNDSGFDDSYLYAGYRYDKESGLYFLNARYYAPGLGRFLTKDSEADVKNTKTLNHYEYTDEDPVNNVDPSGNVTEAIAAGIGLIGEAGGGAVAAGIVAALPYIAIAALAVATVYVMVEYLAPAVKNKIQELDKEDEVNEGKRKCKEHAKAHHNVDLGDGTRIDLKGRNPKSHGHHNKKTGVDYGYPHVHDPNVPGGVRDIEPSDYIKANRILQY